MDRSTRLTLLLLTSPLLACPPPLPEVMIDDTTSTGQEPTTTNPTITTTINPTTTLDSGSTTEMTTTGVDSTTGDPSTSSTGATTEVPPQCGDGSVDAGTEQCDGDDLDGQTCDSLGMGFVDGTLACAGDCTFDVSGCNACGNDLIDPGEDCDGVDLAGATCDSIGMGFVDGTLACATDCSFDVSGCSACGNGVLDAGEDCDGVELGGTLCVDLGGGLTGGALACDAACAFDTAACTSFPLPMPGEVIVTEIMQNPATLADSDGEWFELHNPVPGVTYQLAGCMIEGSVDNGFPIDIDMPIGPMEYRTFATDSMAGPGFVADLEWLEADYNLTNGSDTVRLVCNGMTVDEVSYDDGATFPDPNGQSMNLDPGSFDAAANDIGANWCEGTSSYNGDFGTPGADNTSCGGPMSYPIDFCRLQFPLLIDEVEGTNVDVFGRLYIAGLTDLSGVNDPAPSVIGYVGYGPDGTDPAIDPGWTWVAGTPNAGYGPASPGYEVNNDEYQATLTVPSPGTYDFAFRFSGDTGATFTYCDNGVAGAGSSDGYAPADAGQMTAQMGVVPPLYFSEYAEGGSNNKAIEIYNPPGADAIIDSCTVNFYFNGGVAAGNTINLSGTIPADDVLVICDDNIDPLVFDPMNCDVLDSGTFFNGDDAIELVCAGTTLDVIGEIGLDPGAEWLVGGVGTQNETIRRDCAVTMGDSNGADPFDPSVEWASFPQDDFSDFGQYVCP